MAANATIDHDEIRKWAESKGGKPAAVDRTHKGGDVGIIRIMFPDNPQSEHGSLVEISWEEFFEQFEEAKLALLYEEDSLFSKIVGRDTADRREHGDYDAARRNDGKHGDGRHGSHAQGGGGGNERGGQDRGSQAKGGGERGRKEEKSDTRRVESRSAGGGEDEDLKSREYRDEKGNVHHHTHTYEEQHRGER
jgi:hypothetical protein